MQHREEILLQFYSHWTTTHSANALQMEQKACRSVDLNVLISAFSCRINLYLGHPSYVKDRDDLFFLCCVPSCVTLYLDFGLVSVFGAHLHQAAVQV